MCACVSIAFIFVSCFRGLATMSTGNELRSLSHSDIMFIKLECALNVHTVKCGTRTCIKCDCFFRRFYPFHSVKCNFLIYFTNLRSKICVFCWYQFIDKKNGIRFSTKSESNEMHREHWYRSHAFTWSIWLLSLNFTTFFLRITNAMQC